MLKDKIIVITGAGRGLGKSLAEVLVQKGAKLVLSSKNEDNLKTVSDAVGGKYFTADVTVESDVEKLAKNTIENFGKIDIWINNAGVWLPRMKVEDLDMQRVHEIFEVNVFGTMYGSRSALREMKKQGNGTLMNIVSTSALSGRPFSAAYSASKHAEKGFTDSIREEVRVDGIKVIGVYPGGMKTNLFDEKKPEDFDQYMSVEIVAEKIVANLEKENPEEDLIIKREGQI